MLPTSDLFCAPRSSRSGSLMDGLDRLGISGRLKGRLWDQWRNGRSHNQVVSIEAQDESKIAQSFPCKTSFLEDKSIHKIV